MSCQCAEVAGSNSTGDLHIHFEIFAFFRFSLFDETQANEIKHDIHAE